MPPPPLLRFPDAGDDNCDEPREFCFACHTPACLLVNKSTPLTCLAAPGRSCLFGVTGAWRGEKLPISLAWELWQALTSARAILPSVSLALGSSSILLCAPSCQFLEKLPLDWVPSPTLPPALLPWVLPRDQGSLGIGTQLLWVFTADAWRSGRLLPPAVLVSAHGTVSAHRGS